MVLLRSMLLRTRDLTFQRASLCYLNSSQNSRARVGSIFTQPYRTGSSTGFSTSDEEKEKSAKPWDQLLYEGPLSRPVRVMKGVSITSSILTFTGMPVLLLLKSGGAFPPVGQLALCGTVMIFSLGTTSLFYYLFRPYVSRIWMNPTVVPEQQQKDSDEMMKIETFSLLSRRKTHLVKVSDILTGGPKSFHPMLSFQTKNHPFFIHPENLPSDSALAKKLGLK